jgi:hypothetical protein
VPTESDLGDLISRAVDPTSLSSDTLWWRGPQWLTQEPSSWPTTNFNSPTENLEIKTVHVTQLPEDITQRFSKLNRFTRVLAYCRRFATNCRQPKATRQTATLTTQDLDETLNCCVKIVQQFSYSQKIKDLKQQQKLVATSYLKILHPFIDQEGLLRVGGRPTICTFL